MSVVDDYLKSFELKNQQSSYKILYAEQIEIIYFTLHNEAFYYIKNFMAFYIRLKCSKNPIILLTEFTVSDIGNIMSLDYPRQNETNAHR